MSIFEDLFGISDARRRADQAAAAAKAQADETERQRKLREQAMKEAANLSRMESNSAQSANIIAGGTALNTDQTNIAFGNSPVGKSMASLLGLRT